jgi:hypothetical protein
LNVVHFASLCLEAGREEALPNRKGFGYKQLPVAYLPTPGFRSARGFGPSRPAMGQEYHKLTEAANNQTSSADEVMGAVVLILLSALPVDYKSSVAELITEHLKEHSTCESAQILDILPAVEIVETFHINPNLSGWVHEGKIFINVNKKLKWTDRKVALFLIHELIHLSGLCLNDSIRVYDKRKPICTIFDKPIYHSEDLTNAIKKHFRRRQYGHHKTADIQH